MCVCVYNLHDLWHTLMVVRVVYLTCSSDSEWKTRYETQLEMNQQLSKQSLLLQNKVEEARRSFKESKICNMTNTTSPVNIEHDAKCLVMFCVA